MDQNKKLPERADVAVKDTWALEDLFASDDAWQQEYEALQTRVPSLSAFAGKLGESADTLYACLELQSVGSQQFERLYVYAKEKYDQDTGNATYQAMVGKAQNLMIALSSASAFITPEIMSLPEVYLKECFEKKEELSLYRLTIERLLKKKEHVLSAEMEAVLAKTQEMAEAPSDIFSKFNNADIVFPDVVDGEGNTRQLTNGSYVPFLMSADRVLRKDAFEKLYGVYKGHINTLASTYAANVKQKAFYAGMRKYPSSMEMALSGGNIPTSVYTNLIDTVHKNFAPMHRYIALRKKMLGVDELHMYDVYTPIVSDVAKEITFEEAKDMVLEGLAPLGEDYLSHLREGFENRWIDVYENKGKRTGAYSWGAYGTHPYVLLNHHNDLDHAFTLAHEMGHALHTYYSNKCQPYEYAGYRIFVAEVASTCNEALLMTHLLNKTTDKKERAYLVNSFLEQFRGTLYRQTMFAEFEMVTHDMAAKGITLTADVLCKTYHDLNKQYFGSDMISDDEIAYEWARIPHFYTPFYVYQYATGFSAAIALSRRILKEGEPAVRDYIDKFLSAGNSADPIDVLKAAGVDMSSKAPIEEALAMFDELVTELEELTK